MLLQHQWYSHTKSKGHRRFDVTALRDFWCTDSTSFLFYSSMSGKIIERFGARHTADRNCVEFKILLAINSVNIVDWTSHKLCIPLLCHLGCVLEMGALENSMARLLVLVANAWKERERKDKLLLERHPLPHIDSHTQRQSYIVSTILFAVASISLTFPPRSSFTSIFVKQLCSLYYLRVYDYVYRNPTFRPNILQNGPRVFERGRRMETVKTVF